MAKDLFSRYIWLIDTIKRYGRITRDELNALWIKSPYSNGEPLPRRTFYNYRMAIEEIFNVKVTNVNTLNRAGKRQRTRTGFGQRVNQKRAIVTVAEGQTIDIFGN